MPTHLPFLISSLLLSLLSLPALATEEVRFDEKGTYLGILFRPRAVSSSPGQSSSSSSGVLITQVLPGSPAAQANLRRQDILLRYDGTLLRDADHLATLISTDKPNRKISLLIQRGEQKFTVPVTLAVGPVLKLPSKHSPQLSTPPDLTLYAAPLDRGKMRFTIEYYTEGKLQVIHCEGNASELASTFQKLPAREQNLLRIALTRLRSLTLESPPPKK